MRRAKLLVTGIVQGVGFRPFCVRTAKALGLCGTVRNASNGVEIALEGGKDLIDAFVRAIWEDHPDAAVISDVDVRYVALTSPVFSDFSVIRSSESEDNRALIPADLAVCGDCLAEVQNPSNRRYRYPFTNCTNCGPRYTIIRELPYDRPKTTMDAFRMCPECEREYGDPLDRRYHAQPNACSGCGPKVRLADQTGRVLCEEEAAIARLVSEIAAGRLAAIKGIGGFHIACLPEDDPVRELRFRKHRPDKPFALMARDMDAARRLAQISPSAGRLMAGTQRPIVLCPAKDNAPVSSLVAPGQRRLGIMLPYAPLHHLLMEKFDALVMTSANISDSPIVSSEAEAFSSLGGVADFFLCHDREIHTAIDDSVLLPVESLSCPVFLRRARGYVPNPMPMPFAAADTPDILAAGAQMKSTYALTRGNFLFPGQYLGDLGQLGTAAYYKSSIERFIRLYGIKPKIFAFDKHPGYVATELAREFTENAGAELFLCPVQHHHAHLASVLLDNNCFEPVIGAVFDGTGYGDDGTIWGGEFLVGDAGGFKRMASLLPFRLPGGEKAIHEPWRCGLALIDGAFGATEPAMSLWPELRAKIKSMTTALNSAPVTTSCGRLFDGVSAILRLCTAASYDGQAAMALENAADAGGILERGLEFALDAEKDG
ncbi:MAG: carbamoyltransferase HypF, partial [Synergistaceae bacterium]|nr:carbamoyltransferase HypF [Synergistaceae bacterium]